MDAFFRLLGVGIVIGWTSTVVAESKPISIDDALPYGQQPIEYFQVDPASRIEVWNRELAAGRRTLDGKSSSGYLPAVLKLLDVPETSQSLVFSRTALNPKLVSPETPRAIFFNETTYVGYVPRAAALEIAVVDPVKGWLFYTLKQRVDVQSPPRFQRERQCLACHAGPSALRIPGGVVRAFVTDETGNPRSGYSRITHETPFKNRFGGWYVTGKTPSHRGNQIELRTGEKKSLVTSGTKQLDAILDGTPYPASTSDVIAQLVLQHQIHGQNLLIRVSQEARFGKRSDAEERLLRYLFFIDEAPLPAPVSSDSKFAGWFQNRGPRDKNGRSLREWNLKTRLFRHRLSYLIYSELFRELPQHPKRRIRDRVIEILQAEKPEKPFAKIPRDERQAILEILRATHPDFPNNSTEAIP